MMYRIPELPNEVLQMIFDCGILKGKHLKNIRLASQALARLAAPRLFRMVTVVPYADQLGALASFMRQNVAIARLVQYLEYDTEWRYSHMIEVDEDDSEPEFAESFRQKLSRHALMDDEHSGVELALLTNCMRTLPSLRGVRVSGWTSPTISIYPDYIRPVRSYFRKLAQGDRDIDLQRLDTRHVEEPATKLLLMACFLAGVKLTSLEAREVAIEQLIEPLPSSIPVKELSMYQAVFRGLNLCWISRESSVPQLPAFAKI